jgi:hypothetical protein
MQQVSFISSAVFLVLVALLALAFILAMRGAGGRTESSQEVARWTRRALLIVALWLGVAGGIAQSGVLRRFAQMPPPLMIFAVTFTLATALLAFSSVGTRILNGVSIGWLVGYQAFRFPLELLLHRLYLEGVIPVQMTYVGRNFDILTGLLALVLLAWAKAGKPPRWAILAFNLIGLALLINIVAIALMSAPTPLRRFHNEPALTFVADAPYVWLPGFLVQAAWFGHLMAFRWLSSKWRR